MAIQILLPLRHHLFPGDVSWTEEGHRLSWRMMLRQKVATVSFKITDNNSEKEWIVRPASYLTRKQAAAIAGRPDMAWQFIQILKDEWKQKGYDNISIYARSSVSLNGRRSKPLYDQEYDLSKAEWKPFTRSDWVTRL